MSRMRFLSVVVLAAGLLIAPPLFLTGAEDTKRDPQSTVQPPAGSLEKLDAAAFTRRHCSICHSFQLVEAQRLNRATWEWVLDDMVNQFGAAWLTKEDQKTIINYLVEHYGPQK